MVESIVGDCRQRKSSLSFLQKKKNRATRQGRAADVSLSLFSNGLDSLLRN